MLQVHGTLDMTILYGGGTLSATYPSAVGSVERWNAYNSCVNTADTSAPNLDLVTTLAGAETTVARYTDGCLSGGSGELWAIQSGVHVPALSANYARGVVEYFYAHPKPAVGAGRAAAAGHSVRARARGAGRRDGARGCKAAQLETVESGRVELVVPPARMACARADPARGAAVLAVGPRRLHRGRPADHSRPDRSCATRRTSRGCSHSRTGPGRCRAVCIGRSRCRATRWTGCCGASTRPARRRASECTRRT